MQIRSICLEGGDNEMYNLWAIIICFQQYIAGRENGHIISAKVISKPSNTLPASSIQNRQVLLNYLVHPPGASISSNQNELFAKSFVRQEDALTRMSRQADLRRVIWSAMVRLVNPGNRLANSTILMMHLVESSLNLSHRPRSSWTRWSELEF